MYTFDEMQIPLSNLSEVLRQEMSTLSLRKMYEKLNIPEGMQEY